MIEVEGLCKKFQLHTQMPAYATLVDTFTKFFSCSQEVPLHFWALKELSFNCKSGDRVGIIGPNGAGKSTLLKILSRIMSFDAGRIKIQGRIASLLEVGSGFHLELTGRENIFLNGTILGMRKREIQKKFDEIVAFAEIEQFLDTPVKYFSSGMYSRLGFSIAAHLEPDIFIVDEALAVGDLKFQEKCLKKLNHVSQEGRTILFVSHNASALLNLCNKGILLEKGAITRSGTISECLDQYLQDAHRSSYQWKGNLGDHRLRIRSFKLENTRQFFNQNEQAPLSIEGEIQEPLKHAVVGIEICNSRKQVIASASLNPSLLQKKGSFRLLTTLPTHFFWEGEYTLSLIFRDEQKKNLLEDEISLQFPIYASQEYGYEDFREMLGISLPLKWKADG